MRLAVVKPDHLGDLVLSSPAIRAMAIGHPDLTLFVAGRCMDLARWLFPGVSLKQLDLPHLARDVPAAAVEPDFSEFGAVAILRRDDMVTAQWAELRARTYALFEADDTIHQTLLDYGVARQFAAAYDIDALFFGDQGPEVAAKAARPPASIGLSIGSGFYSNLWPVVRWIDLARQLHRKGFEVHVICGAREAAAAALIAREAALPVGRQIVGTGDHQAFFSAVGGLDLVIGSDGGTAHLCSTVAPVLSIFGSSPIWRYAPFGRWNRLLTQQLPCSPCVQYAEKLVNGCASVECMAEITAEDLICAVEMSASGSKPGAKIELRHGLHMITGLSHADQARQISACELEAQTWGE